MTEKAGRMTEIRIIRRATVDRDFNYYEFHATYDPAVDKGNDIIKEIEKTVAFARKRLAPKEEPAPKEKVPKKKASKIPTKTEDIKIADLQAGDKVNIQVRLVKPIDPKNDIKAFINKTDGSAGKRCKTTVEDDSGKIQLTLFDKQIDLVLAMKDNAWFSIENGYVKDWKGNLELVVGRYGKIESVFNG